MQRAVPPTGAPVASLEPQFEGAHVTILQRQVGIVTGAGRGIGRAIALRLATEGMHVVAVARSRGEIEETCDMARSAGGAATALAVDIRDRASIDDCVSEVVQGIGPIDLLVNNAGSNLAHGPVWDVDADLWRQDIEINLVGTFLFCLAVAPAMIQRKSGRVINIHGGGVSGPLPYDTGYSSAKAAVARFSETFAIEARPHNVQVFPMSPGPVMTQLTRALFEGDTGRRWNGALLQRLEGQWIGPEAAADLALALASGRADSLSGRLIGVFDPLDDLIARADELAADDLHVMRVVTSTSGHVPPVLLTASHHS